MFEIASRLDRSTQLALIEATRAILKQAPLFALHMPKTGAAFKLTCSSAGSCGWTSDKLGGYRYVDRHPKTGAPFPPIPGIIAELATKTAESYGLTLSPQTALVNFYTTSGCLGLHQDIDEKVDAPVISMSLGLSAEFLIGGAKRDNNLHSIRLESGDIMIMGAEHRFHFHGIRRIFPDTCPDWLGMKQPGRINITVRQVSAE